LVLSALLGKNLAGIEFNQHGTVCLQFIDRDRKAKVVEEQELQLEMVQFQQRQTADLFSSQYFPPKRTP